MPCKAVVKATVLFALALPASPAVLTPERKADKPQTCSLRPHDTKVPARENRV